MTFDYKYLSLCDHRIKDRSFIEPDGRTIKVTSPMVASDVRLYRNNKLVPKEDPIFGWSLEVDKDPSSDFYNNPIPFSQDVRKRSIVLNKASKSLDDLWEVIYTVPSDVCRKCQSKDVINDWSFDDSGRIEIVEEEDKLVQDVTKYLITERESHIEHVWYGTNLDALIGSKFTLGMDIRISAEIQEALENFVKLQVKQSLFQTLLPAERVKEVLSINARRGTGEQESILFVDIRILTDADTLAKISFGISAI